MTCTKVRSTNFALRSLPPTHGLSKCYFAQKSEGKSLAVKSIPLALCIDRDAALGIDLQIPKPLIAVRWFLPTTEKPALETRSLSGIIVSATLWSSFRTFLDASWTSHHNVKLESEAEIFPDERVQAAIGQKGFWTEAPGSCSGDRPSSWWIPTPGPWRSRPTGRQTEIPTATDSWFVWILCEVMKLFYPCKGLQLQRQDKSI